MISHLSSVAMSPKTTCCSGKIKTGRSFAKPNQLNILGIQCSSGTVNIFQHRGAEGSRPPIAAVKPTGGSGCVTGVMLRPNGPSTLVSPAQMVPQFSWNGIYLHTQRFIRYVKVFPCRHPPFQCHVCVGCSPIHYC